MTRALKGLILATVTCGNLSTAVAADIALSSRVHLAAATLSESTNLDIAAYQLRFNLELMNASGKAINIPTVSKTIGVSTQAVLGVQIQQADGSWKYLSQGSYYGTTTTEYAACSLLDPGATAEINGIVHRMPMLKARAQELGREPTLRLNITIFCKKPDETVVNVSTTTAPFRLTLPSTDK
jgi:hypothetical protein